MATDTTRGTKGGTDQPETRTSATGSEGTPPVSYTAQETQQQAGAPVYFSRTKKKGKKRRYTKGTKPFQKLVLGASRAVYRAANSFAEGFDTFRKRSKRSARKRRDGLVRDSLRNAARGFSDAARKAGKAPRAFARQIGTKNVRRGFRVIFNPFSFGR